MNGAWRPLRLEPLPGEEAVRRYVAIHRDLEVDPLFRRRLRSTVMNRFVAQREGEAIAEGPRTRRMGRLGRACLWATLATALSVGGVMAASDASVPGDLLYPLKRSIEEMRIEVAPAHRHDELALYALTERIDELSRLIEAGATSRATALASSIREAYARLAESSNGAAVGTDRIASQLTRLVAVLDRAPVGARRAIERAMGGAPGLQVTTDGAEESIGDSRPGTQGQGAAAEHGTGGQDGAAGVDAPDRSDGDKRAERTPKPERTPHAERSLEPSPSPVPDAP